MNVEHFVPNDLKLGPGEYLDETLTVAITGTPGSVTDTTVYPVVDQSTKTEKVTVDGGTEQTVTFTTAIKRGHAVAAADQFPLGTQNALTEKVTINGGSEQTVTFSGALTTAAHIAAAMDAQLSGCSVVVEDGAVHIYSDTPGATSAVAIGTGTSDLVWETPAAINLAADIATQMNDQLTGCEVAVVAGQVKITSDNSGPGSTVAIGTGTTAMAWATAVAGTAVSGVILEGTLLARNSSSGVLNLYNAAGSNDTNNPRCILPYELEFTADGSKAVRAQIAGKVASKELKVHGSSSAVPAATLYALIANSGIIPVSVTEHSANDNE